MVEVINPKKVFDQKGKTSKTNTNLPVLAKYVFLRIWLVLAVIVAWKKWTQQNLFAGQEQEVTEKLSAE
jgi:hypothetical protein